MSILKKKLFPPAHVCVNMYTQYLLDANRIGRQRRVWGVTACNSVSDGIKHPPALLQLQLRDGH